MLRLLADECVSADIISGFRRRAPGIDLVCVHEVNLAKAKDPRILEWAAAEGRVVVTGDRNTLVGTAWERVRHGLPMAGVIALTPNVSVAKAIEDLQVLAECGDPEDLRNQVEYLKS